MHNMIIQASQLNLMVGIFDKMLSERYPHTKAYRYPDIFTLTVGEV